MNQARPQGAPSIYHTCRQRGTPQHKAGCGHSQTFSALTLPPRRAHSRVSAGESSAAFPPLIAHLEPLCFQERKSCRLQLVRQRSKLSTKREGRDREAQGNTGGEEREREERSSFPLSDAGRFEGRTCGDAQARIPATFGRTRRAMLGFNCQETSDAGESLTLSCRRGFPFFLSCCVSWRCCDAQDKANACQKFAGEGITRARCYKRHSGEFMIVNSLFVSAVFIHVLCGGCCRSAAKLRVQLWEFRTMQSGVKFCPQNTRVARN